MKRWLVPVVICIFSLSLSACGLPDEPNSMPKTYQINYQWETDEETGELKDIPNAMWKVQGCYPKTYITNQSVKIDDLCNCQKDETIFYIFEGWYYDSEYKNELIDNTVISTQTGDLTLYAKIVEKENIDNEIKGHSITYKWNEFGVLREGINSFPVGMVEELIFPTEYVEGGATRIPILNTWKKSEKVTYEFKGWYYDENFKHKVVDNIISDEHTGNVTLYAEIVVWLG